MARVLLLEEQWKECHCPANTIINSDSAQARDRIRSAMADLDLGIFLHGHNSQRWIWSVKSALKPQSCSAPLSTEVDEFHHPMFEQTNV
jgi:hypothetical protein